MPKSTNRTVMYLPHVNAKRFDNKSASTNCISTGDDSPSNVVLHCYASRTHLALHSKETRPPPPLNATYKSYVVLKKNFTETASNDSSNFLYQYFNYTSKNNTKTITMTGFYWFRVSVLLICLQHALCNVSLLVCYLQYAMKFIAIAQTLIEVNDCPKQRGTVSQYIYFQCLAYLTTQRCIYS